MGRDDDSDDKSGQRGKPPPTARSYEDRVAFEQAFTGVRPLKGQDRLAKPQAAPKPKRRDEASDEAARQRLDALVGDAIHFKVERTDIVVTGLRIGMHPSFVNELSDNDLRIDAECDLHGLTGDQASRTVTRFVRDQARNGARIVLVIHGKGRHSGGRGVLIDYTIEALTTGAAPLVAAFRTAPRSLGGTGALTVRIWTKH